MEEKSLEEMMSDLSDGVLTTTASTTDEPFVVDMGNAPIPEVVSVVSQTTLKEDVDKMVEDQHSDFYNNNIEKGLDILEKDYVSMKRKEQAIDKQIQLIKEKYSSVFEQIAKLEMAKSEVLKPEAELKEVIARKMFLTGEKKWKGMEVSFTYVGTSFKDKFNMDRFKSEQPNMWAKYMEKNPVREYIRTTLNLLPVREDELNANESIGDK